jgi:hypothetical protein
VTLGYRRVSRALYREVMPGDEGPVAPARAFISYAHDSAEHRDRVRRFWHFLWANGVEAWCDLEVGEQRREWTRLVESAMDDGRFILIVASPEYRLRAAADRPAGRPDGRGVEYEAGLIRERIYRDRDIWFPRVLPVVLPGCSSDDVPDFLLPFSSTVYRVDDYTVSGAENLLRVLTNQPGELRPVPGPRPALPPRSNGRGAGFDELVGKLATLPVMATAEARAQFIAMTADRLGGPVDVADDPDVFRFLQTLIYRLEGRPGGLAGLAATVRSLHRDQPVDRDVRLLVEKLLVSGLVRPVPSANETGTPDG